MKNFKEKRIRFSAFASAALLAFSGMAAYAGDAEGTAAEIRFYADSEKTQPLSADALPTDSYVYYELVTSEGYYCKKLLTNAEYTDGERMIVGNGTELSVDIQTVLAGDADEDGAVTAADLTRIMKYIAVDPETYHLRKIGMYEADNNRDGTLDTKDLTRVMKIIAGAPIDLPSTQSDFIAAVALENTIETYYAVPYIHPDHELLVINSTEELLSYIDMIEADFDTETPFEVSKNIVNNEYFSDEVAKYEEKHLKRDALLAKYDEAFFASHTLAVFTSPENSNTFLGAELRGDTLAVLYRPAHIYDSIIDRLYRQEFIEMPKLNSDTAAEIVYQIWD